jgi:signal peptidase I
MPQPAAPSASAPPPAAPAPRRELAALLSLLAPGLGHYYAGLRFGPAVAAFAAFMAWTAVWRAVFPRFVTDWRTAAVAPVFVMLASAAAAGAHAFATTPRRGADRSRRRLRSYVAFLAAAVPLALGARFVVKTLWPATHTYQLPSASMEPTLLAGDYFLVDLAAYRGGRVPAVGDIVVFRPPQYPNVPYVKRVVAVGGETVSLRGSAVQRGGAAQSLEPAVTAARVTDGRRIFREDLSGRRHLVSLGPTDAALIDWPDGPGRQSVPDQTVFVLGDARDNSTDSRQWGAIPLAAIEGRVVGVVASVDGGGLLRWDRLLEDVL